MPWTRNPDRTFRAHQRRKIKKMYLADRMTPTEIAKEAGASANGIKDILTKWGVYHSNRKPRMARVIEVPAQNEGIVEKTDDRASTVVEAIVEAATKQVQQELEEFTRWYEIGVNQKIAGVSFIERLKS